MNTSFAILSGIFLLFSMACFFINAKSEKGDIIHLIAGLMGLFSLLASAFWLGVFFVRALSLIR